MFIIIAILLCFAISFYVKEILWKQEAESGAYRQTGTTVATPTPQENKPVVRPDKYENAAFVNKHCTRLEDFIINDEINKYDLMKLADLNGIPLHIQPGWYPLALELIKELGTLGWNRKVTCIKEKYATLRFYADYPDYKLFEKYEKLSEHICETCGERGQIRDSSWDYVACRKHYLIHSSIISFISDSGFIYNNVAYSWQDVLLVVFEANYSGDGYRGVNITFNKVIKEDLGVKSNKLNISKWVYGYGNFIANLPEDIPGVDLEYVNKYKQVVFCEICGYKAVYNGVCECCENETYNHLGEGWKNIYETREDYIARKQMEWTLDEGDFYANEMGIYEKTRYHKILYTEERFNEYKNAGDE